MRESESKLERNKRLAREWYEFIGSAQYEKAKEYCSEDFVFWPMIFDGAKSFDLQGFIDLESSHMDATPGFTFEMLNVIAEGDWVACHWVFRGTFPDDSTDFCGIPIEGIGGKESNHDVMTWLRFDDRGKIVEKRAKYNFFFVLKQLGEESILKLDSLMGH